MKQIFFVICMALTSCGTLVNDNDIVENDSENIEIGDLNNSSSIIDKSVVKIFDNGFHKLPDTITKLNENQFLIIDSIPYQGLFVRVSNSDIKPVEIEYFYKGLYLIEELKGIALENILYAFVYFTNFDECPSSTFQSLYIVTNSEIKEIASIHKEADEESDENEPYIEEEKIIYLPSFMNNTIVHKQVGFFQQVSPEVENTKRIFLDRININEPPQNLYIIEHLGIKEDSDTISRKVEFYNWNGYKSTLIKK